MRGSLEIAEFTEDSRGARFGRAGISAKWMVVQRFPFAALGSYGKVRADQERCRDLAAGDGSGGVFTAGFGAWIALRAGPAGLEV